MNSDINILIISKDPDLKLIKKNIIKNSNFKVILNDSDENVLDILGNNSIDIVIIDNKLKGLSITELILKIKKKYAKIHILAALEHRSEKLIVQLLKNGATDYISKPFINEEIINRINRITEIIKSQKKIFNNEFGYYFSDKMSLIIDKIKTAAPTDAPVLISGESGTGKELLARLCHKYSNRKNSFINVNCSALPAEIIEKELFGNQISSSKNSAKNKPVNIDNVNERTIFFDEIGDMPLEMQAKLFRVIQKKETEENQGKVKPRIIASTNKNLEEAVFNKTFREDLFYRINIIRFNIPPLRMRKEEIKPLAMMFLQDFCKKYNKKITGFEKNILDIFQQYNWPGNIRELKNKIEQSVILTNGLWIKEKEFLENDQKIAEEFNINNYLMQKDPDDPMNQDDRILFSEYLNNLPVSFQKAKKDIIIKFEKEFIRYYLSKNSWKISSAAKEIGLYRQELYKRIKDLEIEKD